MNFVSYHILLQLAIYIESLSEIGPLTNMCHFTSGGALPNNFLPSSSRFIPPLMSSFLSAPRIQHHTQLSAAASSVVNAEDTSPPNPDSYDPFPTTVVRRRGRFSDAPIPSGGASAPSGDVPVLIPCPPAEFPLIHGSLPPRTGAAGGPFLFASHLPLGAHLPPISENQRQYVPTPPMGHGMHPHSGVAQIAATQVSSSVGSPGHSLGRAEGVQGSSKKMGVAVTEQAKRRFTEVKVEEKLTIEEPLLGYRVNTNIERICCK